MDITTLPALYEGSLFLPVVCAEMAASVQETVLHKKMPFTLALAIEVGIIGYMLNLGHKQKAVLLRELFDTSPSDIEDYHEGFMVLINFIVQAYMAIVDPSTRTEKLDWVVDIVEDNDPYEPMEIAILICDSYQNNLPTDLHPYHFLGFEASKTTFTNLYNQFTLLHQFKTR